MTDYKLPRRLTEGRLLALCDLAGRLPSDRATYPALRFYYVEGLTQAESARAAGVHVSTVSNAQRRVELAYARLPGLEETVRVAMGGAEP